MKPKSYTAFMRSLKDGDVVRINYPLVPFSGLVVLQIASTQIGYHFQITKNGPMYIIPVLTASRARLIDDGVEFLRSDGSVWVTMTRVAEQDAVV